MKVEYVVTDKQRLILRPETDMEASLIRTMFAREMNPNDYDWQGVHAYTDLDMGQTIIIVEPRMVH